MKYKKDFFTINSPPLSTLHGVIVGNGRISSGAIEFELKSPMLRNILIPKFYTESKAPNIFRISNRHVIEATQEFFHAKTTKQITRLPDTALTHFTMFVYGLLESTEGDPKQISFKSPTLAQDFEVNFSYDFGELDYYKTGTTFTFPVNTVLEIGWDAEDILTDLEEEKNG